MPSMADPIKLEVKGLREAQKAMIEKLRGLSGSKVLQAYRDSTLMVLRTARVLAPVDTGKLRASITPEVVMQGNTVMGVVGSNVEYAPYMELGTRPHWPPPDALKVWAARHNISLFLVCRAIARRGLPARKFLQKAFEKHRDAIVRRINGAVYQVVINK